MRAARAPTKTLLLTATIFERTAGIVHGFSTRRAPAGGNDFNLGFAEGADRAAREKAERNRKLFLEAVTGARAGWRMQLVRQVHSDQIQVIRGKSMAPNVTRGKVVVVPAADGLITHAPGVLLAVQAADCVPVLLADTKRPAVGALHAGWRGTLARIAEKGVGAMRREFGSDPANLRAVIGPCIHACCYQVWDELRDQFCSQFDYGAELFHEVYESDPVREKYPLLFMNMRAPGHGAPPCRSHLDLVAANRRQLLAAGVPGKSIEIIPLCTACHSKLLFSHRAEKGRTGRMMAAIGIAP